MIILGRPHLILTDFGGDDRLALGGLVNFLDHELGLDGPVRLLVVSQGIGFAPGLLDPSQEQRFAVLFVF